MKRAVELYSRVKVFFSFLLFLLRFFFFRYTESRSLFRFPKYWAITNQGAKLFLKISL